jgi:hypothetical protein
MGQSGGGSRDIPDDGLEFSLVSLHSGCIGVVVVSGEDHVDLDGVVDCVGCGFGETVIARMNQVLGERGVEDSETGQ